MSAWQPMSTVPNNVFDVLAKKWDAALDSFTYHRFSGCVLVDDAVIWCSPFPGDGLSVKLTDAGYRPEYWMDIPDPHPDVMSLE